jgi:hypothetical protein
MLSLKALDCLIVAGEAARMGGGGTSRLHAEKKFIIGPIDF